MMNKQLSSLLSVLACVVLFGCTTNNSQSITCGLTPGATVVVEFENHSMFATVDARGCVTHRRDTRIRQIPPPAQH